MVLRILNSMKFKWVAYYSKSADLADISLDSRSEAKMVWRFQLFFEFICLNDESIRMVLFYRYFQKSINQLFLIQTPYCEDTKYTNKHSVNQTKSSTLSTYFHHTS